MTNENISILDDNGVEIYRLVPKSDERVIIEQAFGDADLMRVGFISKVPDRHLDNPNYLHDVRPVCWPVYHPYWIVSFEQKFVVVMAYVTSIDQLKHLWPEAENITVYEESTNGYQYNSRFPRPDWLDEVHSPDFEVKRRIGVFTMTNPDGDVLVGFGDDIDYSMQYIVHQLEYGVFDNTQFQQGYIDKNSLVIEIVETNTIEEAAKLATEKEAFYNSEEDGLRTVINEDNW